MRLFLASEAKNPKSMEILEKYVGGFKGKKIGYIPTAANGLSDSGEVPWEHWKEGGTWKLINTLGAEVDTIILEDHLNLNLPKRLADKDIIWVAGGAAGYLMYWMRRARLDKYLPEILDDKKIYVGSSAGSIVTARTLDIVEWDISDNETGASFIPGMDWVDFDIWPHYEDSMYEEIKKRYKGEKLYLLKNGEAIVWEDGKVEVKGETRIIEKAN